jgi:hypothetical protein
MNNFYSHNKSANFPANSAPRTQALVAAAGMVWLGVLVNQPDVERIDTFDKLGSGYRRRKPKSF